MASVFYLVIFVIICICYGYPRIRKNTDVVYHAFAGSSDERHDSDGPFLTSEKSRVIELPNGKYANTNSFLRVRINGKCMSPVNINNGDEWLAEKINNKSLRSQIKEGDVLFIYLPDTNKYKIRRVKSFIDDTTIETYWYNNDGTQHLSSKPHKANTILGIVKYRLSKGEA